MQDKEKLDHWVFEHFLVYLYLCIADSDYNITDDEIEEIESKLSTSFEEKKDFGNTIAEVLKEYKNHTDYEKTEYITEQVPIYCTTDEIKKKIIKGLEDVMAADGIIKSVEVIMYRYIKKTIENI